MILIRLLDHKRLKKLKKNNIYNSTTPMITNLAISYVDELIRYTTLKDNKDEIKSNLLDTLKDSDIIIFTGGSLIGNKDYLLEIMNKKIL
ncbi:MAG: molybdopterin-binding protein [Promethearchaeota archaeon]